MWEKLSAFNADEKGVVLLLVALLLVPFIVLLGVAADARQLMIVKNQLQSAIDAAALDIGTNPSLTSAQAQTQAQNYVNANFSTQYSSATLSSLAVTQSQSQASGNCPANTVCITATATINTTFLQVINYTTLSTTVSSQVTIAQNHLEVVLVLDNTGSMLQTYGGMTGIQGLITASTTLVNTLFASDPTGQYVKIAVVPFTDNVNVANSAFGISASSPPSWIDNSNATGSLSQEDIGVPTGTGLVTFASTLASAAKQSTWAWQGCVRQRTEPYDTTDVAPGSGATLYTPFFAPDEPDCCTTAGSSNTTFYNNYLKDGTFQTVKKQQQVTEYAYNSTTKTCASTTINYPYASTAAESNEQYCTNKYTSSPSVQSGGYGPNALCTTQPIIPLTNNQSDILSEINLMQAYGATVIPAGLTWGWHMISPTVSSVMFPSNAAVPYTNTNTLKVIILLTDGYNDVQLGQLGVAPTSTTNGFNKSVYSAYGYATGTHLNLSQLPPSLNGVEDQPDYNLDQKEIQLCNNIKAVTDANGSPGRIQIYTIGFGNLINGSQLQLLAQCATDSAHYFYNPTSEELNTTFQNIAIGLSKLRISH